MERNNVKRNMVIQANEKAPGEWCGCLLIVDEVKSFGVQAYLRVPFKGNVYVRLSWEQFDIIGYAVMVETDCDSQEDGRDDS